MGFGGGTDKAQQQATANEAQTQADISSAQAGINKIYDDPSRQAEYDKLGADTTQYYTDDANKQEAINARKLKFSLARSGLVGGSQQAAEGKQLGTDYNNALITASRQGQSAEANLKNADETSRMNLLGLAESGIDGQTLAQRSTASLANNLQSGESTATANEIGNAFGDFASVYQNSQDRKAAQNGQLYGYGSIFSPMFGAGAPPPQQQTY